MLKKVIIYNLILFSVLFFILIILSLWVYKIIKKKIKRGVFKFMSIKIIEYKKTIKDDTIDARDENLNKNKTTNQLTPNTIPNFKDKAIIIPK